MIDLAALLKIKDNQLIKSYLVFLSRGNSIYTKLTVLDYVRDMRSFYEHDDVDYDPVKEIMESRYDRLNVKIQGAFTLLLLYPENREEYLSAVKKYLSKSDDYRAHIRTYNFLLLENADDLIPLSYIRELIMITESKELAGYRSVQSVLKEIKAFQE